MAQRPDSVQRNGKMVLNMRENGRITISMVLASTIGPKTQKITKEIMQTIRSMVLGSWNGLMAANTKDFGRKIKRLALEFTTTLMGAPLARHGLTINSMVTECTNQHRKYANSVHGSMAKRLQLSKRKKSRRFSPARKTHRALSKPPQRNGKYYRVTLLSCSMRTKALLLQAKDLNNESLHIMNLLLSTWKEK